MPIAKRLMAKIARFYRRLKGTSTITVAADNTKPVKLCHKGCNTIRSEFELAELGIFPFKSIQNLTEKESKKSSRIKNKNKIISTFEQVTRAPEMLKMENKRMAAGKESKAHNNTLRIPNNSGLDEGPILETGISKMAFCRQLDNLLQRSLGNDVSRNPSFC